MEDAIRAVYKYSGIFPEWVDSAGYTHFTMDTTVEPDTTKKAFVRFKTFLLRAFEGSLNIETGTPLLATI